MLSFNHHPFHFAAALLLTLPFTGLSQQVSVDQLPLYTPATIRVDDDWLVKPVATQSAVFRTASGHLALSNGLITRTFSVAPNGATIGFDNLVTHESLLRSVSTEAVLWVNGQEIKVGGLTGQPIHNYLSNEWLDSLIADPMSLPLVSWETAPIKARFAWTPRGNWLSRPQSWPPKGLELTFTYKADDATVGRFRSQPVSDDHRTPIWTDTFLTLSPRWKVVSGANGPKLPFANEGKAGEILASASSVVYGEQAFPENTQVIIFKLNTGTDLSTTFGPGVALVYPDGTRTKFYLSPGDRHFGVYHKGSRQIFDGFDPGKSWYLRMELSERKLHLSVSDNGKTYRSLPSVAVDAAPALIRVGKTDPTGANADEYAEGPLGRSKIEELRLLGSVDRNGDAYRFLESLLVKVHYELYDGIPLVGKWVTVENLSDDQFTINNLKSEHLAVAEAESAVEGKQRWELPPIFAQSDFAFQSMSPNASENACIEWKPDPTYKTQVNYNLMTPTVLECMPKHGIGQEVTAGKPFESMRLWELVYDATDRERRGLAQRKMYRTLAPWATENPIIMHVSSAEEAPVKKAIDQCAEVGFEMVIMTFGSGFNAEDTTAANLVKYRNLRDYANRKNVGLGAYSLLASRSIDARNDVVMPEPGMKPIFGNSPCLQSEWGNAYFQKLYTLYEKTGLDLLEHDGSYPGDVCASTDHPGHTGLEDSQWKQFTRIRDFYVWCRAKGIYLNIPDWYYLAGSSKIAMGYRETNWSLPRAYQEIIERQNIYDGTWEKTPSMGWMFVPLVQYHGGGAEATIEPLKEHLPHYGQRLANLFGAGVQACYRGPQLYDAPETKALVKHWVDFYKKHRRVLDSDIIHIRRPDGRDYDAILHADPSGTEKGLLMVYNPLDEPITRSISIDLYYTGLIGSAQISEADKPFQPIALDGSKMKLTVNIPAKSQTWFVLK